MAADLEIMAGGYVFKLGLNVAASQVLGYSAIDAEQMMVVALATKLIPEIAILQQHPTKHSGIYQQLQRAVNGSSAHPRKLLPQCLSGKVFLLLGKVSR